MKELLLGNNALHDDSLEFFHTSCTIFFTYMDMYFLFFSFFFFTKIELHCVFLNLIFLRYFSCQYTWVKCIFNSCIIFHGRNGFNLTLIFPYWYVCFLLVFHYPKGEVNLGEGEKKRYP